jgi:hypothetical protein
LRESKDRIYHRVIIFIESSENILNEVFIIKGLPAATISLPSPCIMARYSVTDKFPLWVVANAMRVVTVLALV